MRSNKPYLVRAFYEWIVDNQCTPFVVINATSPRSKVPEQFIENGEITLNISPDAVRDLKISNDFIEFRASFSSVIHFISAPIKAILAIYAQENQQGMFFDFEDDSEEWSDVAMQTIEQSSSTGSNSSKKSSHLRLVE